MAKSKTRPARRSTTTLSPVSSVASTRFDAAARALPDDAVRNPAAFPREWLTWANGIASVAAQDAATLVRVPLEDGNLTAAEILELAPLVEYVRAAKADLDAEHANTTDLDPNQSALLASVREDQRTIIRAFRTLRFRRNKLGLSLIRSLVRGAPNDPPDAVQDNNRLLTLCNSADHEQWLASLPKNEGQAALRLWDRHNDLVALSAGWRPMAAAHAARELTHRLWSLLRQRLDRVLVAGRYLTAGTRTRRWDYRGFRRPTKAKR